MKKFFILIVTYFFIFHAHGFEKIDKNSFEIKLLKYTKDNDSITLTLTGTNKSKSVLFLQSYSGVKFINQIEDCLFYIQNSAFLEQEWKLVGNRTIEQIKFGINEPKKFEVEIQSVKNALDLSGIFEHQKVDLKMNIDRVKIIVATFVFTKSACYPVMKSHDYEQILQDSGLVLVDSFILN